MSVARTPRELVDLIYELRAKRAAEIGSAPKYLVISRDYHIAIRASNEAVAFFELRPKRRDRFMLLEVHAVSVENLILVL